MTGISMPEHSEIPEKDSEVSSQPDSASVVESRTTKSSSEQAPTTLSQSQAAGADDAEFIRDQDRLLPIANVSRIMKQAIPSNAKIAKDAKETVQECVSELIAFISSEASDRCQQEKRKTINGDDIIWAFEALGFEQYSHLMKIYLQRYKDVTKMDKGSVNYGATDGADIMNYEDSTQGGEARPIEMAAPYAFDENAFREKRFDQLWKAVPQLNLPALVKRGEDLSFDPSQFYAKLSYELAQMFSMWIFRWAKDELVVALKVIDQISDSKALVVASASRYLPQKEQEAQMNTNTYLLSSKAQDLLSAALLKAPKYDQHFVLLCELSQLGWPISRLANRWFINFGWEALVNLPPNAASAAEVQFSRDFDIQLIAPKSRATALVLMNHRTGRSFALPENWLQADIRSSYESVQTVHDRLIKERLHTLNLTIMSKLEEVLGHSAPFDSGQSQRLRIMLDDVPWEIKLESHESTTDCPCIHEKLIGVPSEFSFMGKQRMPKSSDKVSKRSTRIEEISDDEIDKNFKEREKIMLGESDEDFATEDGFDEEALLNLPSNEEEEDEEEGDEQQEYSDADVFYGGEDADDGEEDSTRWGRSKKAYYSADADALEEEASEAKKLQKKRLESMKMSDFTGGKLLRGDIKTKNTPVFLSFDEEDEGENDSESEEEPYDVESEEFELNEEQVASLSAEERMELLANHSTDFKALIIDFKEKLAYLEVVLIPIKDRLDTMPTSEGLEFLKVKYQLLSGYCSNVAFYLQLKLCGKPVQSHPVLDRLVRFRLLLEKVKPMEAKLKYHIDRLLKAALGPADLTETDETCYRPNPDMLVRDGADSAPSAGEENDGVYKVPKVAPMHYPEEENAKVKRESFLEKTRKSRASSRLLEELRAEYDEAPEEESFDIVYGAKKGSKEFANCDAYEEENYVRFTLDKKTKQKLKDQTSKPIDELAELDDFLGEIEGMGRSKNGGAKPSKNLSKKMGLNMTFGSVEKFDEPPKKGSKRSTTIDDESEIEDDFYDEVKSVKKAKKTQQARPRPQGPVRFKPVSDMKEGAQVRPASWKMLKNKGLGDRRPKETRNPRVRQRMRFEKAQKRLGSFKPVTKQSGGNYQGESTGIRTNLTRSTKF